MRASLIRTDFLSLSPETLRNTLQSLDGVGPKTAAWVIRNLLGSDNVAILDIHVVRVCQLIGLFPAGTRLPRDYQLLERLFLSFAQKIGARPSLLDEAMWSEARTVLPRRLLVDTAFASKDA
jgi:thermostable 8-oxoguanine DNA glycosylase